MPAQPLTEGLWSYPLLAIGVALAGVVVAALLVWSTIIRPANANHREQTASDPGAELRGNFSTFASRRCNAS